MCVRFISAVTVAFWLPCPGAVQAALIGPYDSDSSPTGELVLGPPGAYADEAEELMKQRAPIVRRHLVRNGLASLVPDSEIVLMYAGGISAETFGMDPDLLGPRLNAGALADLSSFEGAGVTPAGFDDTIGTRNASSERYSSRIAPDSR